MQEQNSDQCLDIDERVRKADSEVQQNMEQLGIPNASYLQQLEITERNVIIAKLKA